MIKLQAFTTFTLILCIILSIKWVVDSNGQMEACVSLLTQALLLKSTYKANL
jgi:hypothetical protein